MFAFIFSIEIPVLSEELPNSCLRGELEDGVPGDLHVLPPSRRLALRVLQLQPGLETLRTELLLAIRRYLDLGLDLGVLCSGSEGSVQ